MSIMMRERRANIRRGRRPFTRAHSPAAIGKHTARYLGPLKSRAAHRHPVVKKAVGGVGGAKLTGRKRQYYKAREAAYEVWQEQRQPHGGLPRV